jgi:PAS domain S-box-containing protein
MNILDMRTIILISVITYILCTLFIVQLWRQNRRRFAGMALWVFNFALQTAALTLIFLRGAIPDLISVVFANTLLFAGALAGYMGLERFVRKKGPQIHNYVLLVLYAGAFVYATFIHPDLQMRTLIVSVGLLIVSIQCLWLLWRRVELTMRPLTFGVGMVFGGYCVVSIVRIVEYFVGAHTVGDFFHSGAFQALMLVSYQMLLILLTYSLVLMVNKRLLMEIGTQEEKFTKAFHSTPYAITLSRLSDGIMVDVNESFVTIMGYDRAEVLGKKTMDLHIWEREEDRAAVVEALTKTGKVRGMELPFRNKSGDVVTGLISAEIIRIDGEKHMLASIGDITDRKKAEVTLRESEEKFRLLIENAPDAIFVHAGARFIYLNRAAVNLFGAETADQLIGTSIMDRFHSDYQGLVTKRIHDVYEERKELPIIELSYLRLDGSLVPVEAHAVPITYNNEKAALTFVRDITDRKRAEEALRESEELFRVSMERAPDGVYMNDLEGNFLYGNCKAEELIGYKREELIGRNFLDFNLIAEGSLGKAAELLKSNIEGISTGPDELEMVRKDGRHILIEITTNVIRRGGQTNVLAFVRDITERKQAEEEKQILKERLQRSEKMEALGTLAGGVAHDLNNVLGVLTGYSELLLGEIPEGDRSRGRVEKILQSTAKGATIIQDLLTLARRGVTAIDVINLNAVVSGFLKTPVFEKMKNYHPRVTFRTECDNNLLNIKGSPVHLEKTLMNLVSNAAESISGDGEVTIRTESRYLDKAIRGYDEVKEGDYTVLTVSDTGKGISTEDIEKIFEPFYTKKTMGRSGTGLGLAIVWGTVKDHDGYIDIQTEMGMGTTFTLYFRATREERTAQRQKVPIAQYMGNGESVLVVDDFAEQRDIAASLLTRMGYNVHVVSSGEEAVEYLKENKADILVLDMIMAPGIDGLETYQRILEINPKQKAIIVSGFSETDRVCEAQNLGAGSYVKKPYIMEKIGVAIRDELRKAG